MMNLRVFSLVFLAAITPVAADTLQTIDLAPIKHARAQLTVVSPGGKETVYTPADLEKLETFRLTTTTPWRETPAKFDGVLLSDLLEKNGIGVDTDINVVAENDYTVKFSKEVLAEVPILVATRVDDKPHSRRARGPIQFVIDHDLLENSDLAEGKHLVWMAARIELVH